MLSLITDMIFKLSCLLQLIHQAIKKNIYMYYILFCSLGNMCYNFAYLMHTRFSYIHSRLPVLYTLSTCFVWVPVQIFGYGILVEIETSFRNEVLKNCRFSSSSKCLHLLFIVFQDFEGLLMCFILSFSDVCQLQEL